MAYPYNYGGYPSSGGYYPPPPMPDQLAQLRQGYQQPMPQQPVQTAQPVAPAMTAPVSSNIIWVQGEEGAKAYMVAAGNTVQLWDSENPVIYLKTTDPSGMPSMRILDYTERQHPQKRTETPLDGVLNSHEDFVKRDEFDALTARVEALTAKRATKAKDSSKESEE